MIGEDEKRGLGNGMIKLRTYDMFLLENIKLLFHRLTPEKVDAPILEFDPVKFNSHSMLTVVLL